MEDKLRFDGRVVIVTGAGAGLGRAYALLFASRGASVVVNDLGGSRSGDGTSTNAADNVTNEIIKSGGIAVPDYNSVVEGEKIVKTALDNFGRIDILINNAGILRDKSFARISNNDWDLVHDVHLKGAFKTSQAAWPHFRKQKYGKIIFTSSNSGLYGNFGQANYSAAKMGLIGLCNTLVVEGATSNIFCNVIVPTAASRLTEGILPPELFQELKPELIAPVVGWLCHESCIESGAVIETAGGWATKYGLVRGPGSILRKKITDSVTIEDVKRNWDKVVDLEFAEQLYTIQESMGKLMDQLDLLRNGSKVEELYVHNIKVKDCILYALAIGASVENESDMQYLYENHENFSSFPTMAVVPAVMSTTSSNIITSAIPGKHFFFTQALHGEQYLEIYHPLPTEGVVYCKINLLDVLDKGKNAVILLGVDTFDESGMKLSCNQVSIIVIDGGGFGGKRYSQKAIQPEQPPNRPPDAYVEQKTSPDQAALYRLTGDLNPLHIDTSFAEISGHARPILHGMCSLGFSARHVLDIFGNSDPANLKAIKVRLSKPVIPGETLKTDMWRVGNRVFFRTTAMSSEDEVISGAYIDLHAAHFDKIKMDYLISRKIASDIYFGLLNAKLTSSPEICKKINGVFVYYITEDQGTIIKKWTCDFINGDVYEGDPTSEINVDAYLTINDKDLMEMALGKLNPQKAFMSGKLKIKGNMSLSQKLGSLISYEAKL